MKYQLCDANNAVLYLIGIGADGCQFISFVKDKGIIEGVTLAAIHSDGKILAESGADITINIHFDQLGLDDSGQLTPQTKDYLLGCLNGLLNADAFFILPDLRDKDASLMSIGVITLLADERATAKYSNLRVAIVTEPQPFEGLTVCPSFKGAYQQLLVHCDSVILNNRQQIAHSLKGKDRNPEQYITQGYELSYQAIRCATDLIVLKGLVGFDFADVRSIFFERGEAIFAIGKATGKNRTGTAANRAVLDLQSRWGSLSHPDIAAILVNISATEVGTNEFNTVGNIIHDLTHEGASLKIGTTFDDTMQPDEIKVAIIVVKRRMDS